MAYFGKEAFETSMGKLLREGGSIGRFSHEVVRLPAVPADGVHILEMLNAIWAEESGAGETVNVLLAGSVHVDGDLLIGNTGKFDLKAIICDGSLSISGDFLNDEAELTPALIVMGDLAVSNWMRGGMPCFVGGNVSASGVIIGEYEDGPLFVGGNLQAANGYIKRIRPYPDLPDIGQLHQIAGSVNARTLDLCQIKDFDSDLGNYLTPAAQACYGDEQTNPQGAEGIIALSRSGTPIWR